MAKSKTSDKSKYANWTFPQNTLEDAIIIAQAIEEKHAGKPVKADELAAMVGYSPSDWRFKNLLKAANMYGLVSGSGSKASVSLSSIGANIVAPSSPQERQDAFFAAFMNVDQFKSVSEFYQGKKIPEGEYFANTLTKEFGISKDRVAKFTDVFLYNVSYLKTFGRNSEGERILPIEYPENHQESKSEDITPASPTPVNRREFLDTCFVLMPFAEWPDRYYKDIYTPAIKDAGFEPLRGDGIFDSGSVMEQIWLQIKKAKVLVADLTGRNPNVFYELGLAHAKSKPVVFVSGNIDDVPFDVRHLRVVTYDIREPNWGDKLRKDITTYLKAAKTDPQQSIPQPFREPSHEDQT